MDCLVLTTITALLLHTAVCCNDFRDFCDEADLPFPELGEAGAELTSLASLMDTRLGTRQRRMQRRLVGTITPLAAILHSCSAWPRCTPRRRRVGR